MQAQRTNRSKPAAMPKMLWCALALSLVQPLAGCKRGSAVPPPAFGAPEVRASSPTDPGGFAVTPATPLIPGQTIQVLWGPRWYQSRVVAAQPDGAVRIHYLGWADSSDDSVARTRVRIGGIIPPSPTATVTTQALLGAVNAIANATANAQGTTNGETALSSTADPGGMPVNMMTAMVPGQVIQVHWGSNWYQSSVVAPQPDGTVRIHYFGWSSSSDSNVTRDRIRIGGSINPVARNTGRAGAPTGETELASTNDPGGIAPPPTIQLNAGQPVQIHWGARWYQGRVVSALPDGTVRVHYQGWSPSADENMGRDRLRIGGRIL